MELYLLTQDVVSGYDTYDSIIVAAESEDDAREIHPDMGHFVTHVANGVWMGTYKGGKAKGEQFEIYNYAWVDFADIGLIDVRHIGTASDGIKRGVILASFNPG